MTNKLNIPSDYPIEHLAINYDIVSLVKNKEWDKLNNIAICKDKENNIISKFGDTKWSLKPYFSENYIREHEFNFEQFKSSFTLTIELKLIIYGWIFHKSGRQVTPAKPRTIISRYSDLKLIYQFLLTHEKTSLKALGDPKLWNYFEEYIKEKKLSQHTIELKFVAINNILLLQKWIDIDFNISKIKSKELAVKLSNKTQQQTLTIPERIADNIYSAAIEKIEMAFPYRYYLLNTEIDIQNDYIFRTKELDRLIDSGNLNHITTKRRYSAKKSEIKSIPITEIINRNLSNTPLSHYNFDGRSWISYYNDLITACYICCGAFTGMRDSELKELSIDSYFEENIDGKTFHLLQSKTFKFGEKKATWVTAAICKKAIELMSILTKEWRSACNKNSPTKIKNIWINQVVRSKYPSTITNWPHRLKTFVILNNIIVTEDDYDECIKSNPNSLDLIKQNIFINKPWPLSSHQFRRSLAFYTIKHRLGSTISLKQQFKHLYLQMTEWYCEGSISNRLKDLEMDKDLQILLDETKIQDTTQKFFDWVHNDKPLSGVHGKAIVAMRNDIPHIYSSWDIIYDIVKKGQLTLHGTMHSYCKNGYKCDMDGIINPTFCIDCSSGSSIIDEDNAQWWQKKHLDLTKYLASNISVSPSIYSHCITQIRAAESVMTDFGIDFSVYTHPVEFKEL
ncbi:hypothetical protein [Photobacterium toruni]|uniref:Phage integrase family protein n=1 Tax=Photobacterium toruni TaxID=1935446 RepID=A0A1T4UY64_9GAMM|nr:hypothetical protein [Photobacterium toruni]SKA57331.1 hypothetical protein CZ814_03852 [Photobacterium toruni]